MFLWAEHGAILTTITHVKNIVKQDEKVLLALTHQLFAFCPLCRRAHYLVAAALGGPVAAALRATAARPVRSGVFGQHVGRLRTEVRVHLK